MSAYDTILAALDVTGMDYKIGSKRTRSQCPSHNSTGLTLSLTPGDGRVHLRCFAGCEDTDVLAVLGLGVGDLFDEKPRPGYCPPPRPEPTPWEAALARLGIHNGPPVEHMLRRCEIEAIKEGHALADAALAAQADQDGAR